MKDAAKPRSDPEAVVRFPTRCRPIRLQTGTMPSGSREPFTAARGSMSVKKKGESGMGHYLEDRWSARMKLLMSGTEAPNPRTFNL
jgi:hypothetical protein